MEETPKTFRESAKDYFHALLDMRSNMLDYDSLHAMMEENTVIHGANMWILMLAVLIASIGLNVNSTAVIIGAMLISPLMSGILAIGYALAIRDLTMLRHAASRFATQVVISLVASTIYFAISPLKTPTEEMLARTSPTLWDVLIALFGGIAGSIGNTRQKTSNVVPGVAIATALMPPLCTAGYGIATRQLSFFLGASYLFMINTLFIALSAFFVTKMLGVPVVVEYDKKRQRHISRVITVITIITIIPSVLVGAVTVWQSVVESNVSRFLEKEFVFTDTALVTSNVDRIKREISVSLVGLQIPDEKIEEITEKLDDYDLGDFTLHVTQNKQTEGEMSDKVKIAVQENTINELQERADALEADLEDMRESEAGRPDCAAIAKKAQEVFPQLREAALGLLESEDEEHYLFSARADEALTPDEQQLIINFVNAETGTDNSEISVEMPAVTTAQTTDMTGETSSHSTNSP